MRLTTKLMSNTVYLSLDWTSVTLLSLIFWLIVGKFVPPNEYGIISTVTAITPLISIISLLGIPAALQKLIPEYAALKNGKARSLIKFLFSISISSTLIVIIIFIGLSSNLTKILKIPFEALLLASGFIFALSLYTLTGSVVYGFQNMRKYFVTDLIGHVLKVFITLIAFYLGFNYLGALYAILIGFLVAAILRLDLKWFTNRTSNINRSEVIFDYSLPALIASLALAVFASYQYLVLPILQNQTVAGLFAIAMRITFLISIIPYILTIGVFPIISQLSISKKNKSTQEFFVNQIFRYAAFIVLPLTLFTIFFSDVLILIFANPEYLSATSLFPILATGSAILGFGSIFLYILYAIRQPKINRNIAVASSLTFIVLSLILSPKFSSFGLSIAFLLSSSILFIASSLAIRKYISIKLGDYMWKIIFASLVFFVFLYFPLLLNSKIIARAFLLIPGIIFYLITLFKFNFYTNKDLKILKFLEENSPFFKKELHILTNFVSKYVSKQIGKHGKD